MKHATKALQAKGLAASLLAVMLVFAGSCSEKSATLGPSLSVLTGPARIEVTPAADTLNAIGDTVTLAATVYDSADVVLPDPVTWATSSAARATVSNGFVTATGRGKVNISARIGTVKGISVVLVRQVVQSLTVTPTPVNVNVGDTIRLTALATDSNGMPVVGGNLAWRSGNTSTATVDSTGLVTVLAGGLVVITVRISGPDIVSTLVGRARITGVYPPGSFQITPSADTIRTMGSSKQLTATEIIVGGVSVPVIWKSLNPSIVAIDSLTGIATAVGRGNARITARANTLADTSDVRVVLATASVDVSPDSLFVERGGTASATGEQVESSGYHFGSVVWSSRDTTIATVSAAGLVTGIANGTVSVLGTRAGFTDSVVVVVAIVDATTHTWAAGVAGTWREKNKWTPKLVPANTDTAVVPHSGSVISLTANEIIRSMTLGAGASVALGTYDLIVRNDLTLDPTAAITSGGGALRLTGAGFVSGVLPRTQVTGPRSLSGDVKIGGTLTIDALGAITIESNALVIDNP
jgi:uncharacterized protein YjdB